MRTEDREREIVFPHIKMSRKWARRSSKGRLTLETGPLMKQSQFRSEVIVHELLHLKGAESWQTIQELTSSLRL